VSLVNAEFANQLKTPLEAGKLNVKVPRILRAIEVHLEKHPLTSGAFGHYRPARFFSENVTKLWSNVSDETKSRFETVFIQLNSLLRK